VHQHRVLDVSRSVRVFVLSASTYRSSHIRSILTSKSTRSTLPVSVTNHPLEGGQGQGLDNQGRALLAEAAPVRRWGEAFGDWGRATAPAEHIEATKVVQRGHDGIPPRQRGVDNLDGQMARVRLRANLPQMSIFSRL